MLSKGLKWVGVIVLAMIVSGTIAVILADRDASRRLAELNKLSHQREAQGLAAAAQVLDEIENSSAWIFLGEEQVNQVLTQFDETDVPLNDTNLQLRIISARADFKPGYPKLTVKAFANDPDRKVSVKVHTDAALYLTTSEDGRSIQIQPVIFDLVPTATFGPVNWRGSGMVKKLVLLRANDEIARLGALDVPAVLDLTQKIDRPKFALDVPVGSHTAFTLNAEAGSDWVIPLTLQVRTPLVLESGIHFAAEVL